MGRTKEKIAQSKRTHTGSLAIVDYSQEAQTCILRAFYWFADTVLSLSGARSVMYCFVFDLLLSMKPRNFLQSFFDTHFLFFVWRKHYCTFSFRVVFFYLVTTG